MNESLKFNEEEVLNNNSELFKKLAKIKDIEFIDYTDNNKP